MEIKRRKILFAQKGLLKAKTLCINSFLFVSTNTESFFHPGETVLGVRDIAVNPADENGRQS